MPTRAEREAGPGGTPGETPVTKGPVRDPGTAGRPPPPPPGAGTAGAAGSGSGGEEELERELAAVERQLAALGAHRAGLMSRLARTRAVAMADSPEAWRDWGNAFGEGLPGEVLALVAEKLDASHDADYTRILARRPWRHALPPPRAGTAQNLFLFALVCKGWRKVQRDVAAQSSPAAPLRTRAINVLASGSTSLVEWALAAGCPTENAGDNARQRPSTAVEVSAALGAEVVLRHLVDRGFSMDTRINSGHSGFGSLGWWAAMGGENDATAIRLLRFLKAKGQGWKTATCAAAAGAGKLEVLRWLRAEGCPWDSRTCLEAAWNGHIDVLIWARMQGCPLDASCFSYAAMEGNQQVLEQLRRMDCPMNADAASFAASEGKLDVLQYLRRHGAPWDARVCTAAVHYATRVAGREEKGLEVLRWARANGCEWDAITRMRAARLGYCESRELEEAGGW